MLGDLATPETLFGYFGLMNQSLHALIVGALAFGVVWLLWCAFNRSLKRASMWLVVVVAVIYLLAWEIGVQGWQGHDTLADSAFVTCGALWACLVHRWPLVALYGGIALITVMAGFLAYMPNLTLADLFGFLLISVR